MSGLARERGTGNMNDVLIIELPVAPEVVRQL